MADKLKPGDRQGPSQDQVRTFAAKIVRAKAKTDEARADLGQLYSQVEAAGIHRPAFKLALKLKGMEPTAASEYMRCLTAYLDDLGVTAQEELFDEGAQQAEEVSAANGEAVDYSQTQAFQQGAQAGADGKAATINPYPPETPGAAAWNSGWLKEQQRLATDLGNGHAAKKTAAKAEKKTKGRSRSKAKGRTEQAAGA